MLLENDIFLMLRFFISLITSVFSISLKDSMLLLLIQLLIIAILVWLSNLAIIDSLFLVSDEEVGRKFSLIPRFFRILTKNTLNLLANLFYSSIIFVLSNKVMSFPHITLLQKFGFTILQYFLKSVKLLILIFSY